MRIALLSDVHANLHALDAVLADIAARDDVAARYHLGDLVGYAAFPDAVVERLEAHAILGIAGNYDFNVATGHRHGTDPAGIAPPDPLHDAGFEWTCAHTSALTKRRLAALPFRLDLRPLGGHGAGPTLTLVHSTPESNLVYVTEDRPDDFLRAMAVRAGLRPGDAIAFGHTHKPWTRSVDGIRFVNTGSVGRPKDGDPRAGYVTIEFRTDGPPAVEIVRVAYDVDAARSALVQAGLPATFGDILARARVDEAS
jgi:predicted phosphodiesterase